MPSVDHATWAPGRFASPVATDGTRTQILAAAPWLTRDMSEEERAEAAARALAPTLVVDRGPWDPPLLAEARAWGILVLDGVLARRASIRGHFATELMGPGDVVRPWSYAGPLAPIAAEATFTAHSRITVALLDEEFAASASPWPHIAAGLIDEAVDRTRRLALALAVRHAVRVEERLLLTMWQLADRWGVVGRSGTVIRLPNVTHALLADLVGARRPTVSLAIRHLRERGLLERRAGLWVLCEGPSMGLEHEE